ncbi:hypothetical protein ACKTEK_01505 [Tepidamorphus sp. 3E244]|uniref:hypothetical protein n=1 Tax=Tepidamorphus sp. 3E244 TaxID=3385498 RepID=UPI0038FCFC17
MDAPATSATGLQNRVTPFGDIIGTPARGAMMGNRGGRFHHPETRQLSARRWASKRWICCRLDFKDRQRTVWGDGYTELFFHDEASALAAGHRPCFECRRHEAVKFADAVRRAFGLTATPDAGWMDERLHAERLVPPRERRTVVPESRLPDGTVVASADRAFVISGGEAYPWLDFGWGPQPVSPALLSDLRLVTPPLALGALDAGYRPLLRTATG